MPRQNFSVNYFGLDLAPVAVAAGCVMIALIAGCSGAPAGVDAPSWDPSGLADEILAELDKNTDAALSEEELAGAPGLAAGLRYIDTDKDGQASRAELEARFETYRTSRVGLRSPAYSVTYKGRPVSGATVDFLPEPWLAEIIEPAHGQTDEFGHVSPQAEGADLPGMRVGYYRVKVTSQKTKIPEKYASDSTPLGAEASLADDASSYGSVELKLAD